MNFPIWFKVAQIIPSSPKADGFRMPAEFEPHAGTWMLWPQRPDNWRMAAKPAQAAFAAVARAIAQFERVSVGANPDQISHARQMLPGSVRVVEIASNDAWMRDCGPSFVVDDKGSVRGVDWEFNAWGGLVNGLYFPWDLDQAVAQKVLEIEGVDRYKAPLVLEGGSIHVDGQGTCLTTEECLLSPGRNPGLTRDEIESYLQEYLGVDKVLWIPNGVFNDETSGHVDNLVCFIRPGVVALTWTEDPADPQYERSQEAFEYLSSVTDARGRRLDIHKIHQPNPVLIRPEEAEGVDAVAGTLPRTSGDRLAASYINFYFCNGALIVPAFDDPHDQPALETLHCLIPERKVVSLPAREILLGGGNIHCITQQQPLATTHLI
jgi:agmatine deiminase